MKLLLRATVVFVCAFAFFQCEPSGEARYACYGIQLFEDQALQTPLMNSGYKVWAQNGERLSMLEQGETSARIQLADGTEGWVGLDRLAIKMIVVSSDDEALYRRPAVSSGKGSTAERFIPGALACVMDEEENEEGRWYSVQGGASAWHFKPFTGWIKEGSGYVESAEIVELAKQLNEALKSKDREQLEELAGKASPVGEVAAAALAEMEEAEVEEESAEENESETETEGGPDQEQ